MTITATTPRKTLRMWPGIALAIAVVVLRYLAPLLGPDLELFEMPVALIGILGGLVCALAVGVWWLLFSRAPWLERLSAIALMAIAVYVTRLVVHESIAGGMMGMMLTIYSFPLLAIALVAWAFATRGATDATRRALLPVAVALALVPWTLVRTAGTLGAGSEFHWRWTPTPEERLLARGTEPLKPLPPPPTATAEVPSAPTVPEVAREAPAPKVAEKVPEAESTKTKPAPAPAVANAPPPEWPGFRGPDRDSVIHGVRINTDWSQSPPVEMWRRPIGPGWSSFAVHGDLFYTQEQRGEEEIVSCYRMSTGEPVWMHRDPVRFWESNGGAGPRATPTLSNGRVYAHGATGVVNALDAATGKVLWSQNAASDTGVEVPDWGFASSPVVVKDVVIVAAAGRLVGYDAATGNRRWLGPTGGGGYSSPHVATIDGVTQVLLLRGSRTTSVSPVDGTMLWEHVWEPGTSIVQPGFAENGDVLVASGASTGTGIRRLALTHSADKWNVEERWTTRGLKPYFNDFVVHKGHAYGFDGSILSSIDLANGDRKWKGGRYGNGQLVLLADQDLLLVLSEEGELALVSATTDQYREVARHRALNAKTWNHPVVVKDVLLIRNGEEMVAFRLSPVRPTTDTDLR